MRSDLPHLFSDLRASEFKLRRVAGSDPRRLADRIGLQTDYDYFHHHQFPWLRRQRFPALARLILRVIILMTDLKFFDTISSIGPSSSNFSSTVFSNTTVTVPDGAGWDCSSGFSATSSWIKISGDSEFLDDLHSTRASSSLMAAAIGSPLTAASSSRLIRR